MEKENFKRYMKGVFKEASSDAKQNSCELCKTNCDSFCNSHSVPRFILKEISENGNNMNVNELLPEEIKMKTVDGVNRTGTFKIICRKCDSSFFKDYENPDILFSDWDKCMKNKILSQISTKNILKRISKRLIEIELNENVSKNIDFPIFNHLEVSKLDLLEYREVLKFHKSMAKNISRNGYKIIYKKILDYKSPIATQSPIAIGNDFEDNCVNDLYNFDENYKIENLHTCVFPYKNKTLIILFIEKSSKRYIKFEQQFNKFSETKKLEIINSMIFNYVEDFYIHPKLLNNISDKTKGYYMDSLRSPSRKFDLEIDNLLSPSFGIVKD